jgi:hypothetical protein
VHPWQSRRVACTGSPSCFGILPARHGSIFELPTPPHPLA